MSKWFTLLEKMMELKMAKGIQGSSAAPVQLKKAFVRVSLFWDVAGESKAFKNNGKDRKHRPSRCEEIVERALSKLGEIGYNVLWKNCEHFAAWCRYGVEWSEQVDTFLTGAGVFSAVVAGIAILIGFGRQKYKQGNKT